MHSNVARLRPDAGAIGIKSSLGTVEDLLKNVQTASPAIRQMAQQTKLRAINASVEAARAGDAGRGYADGRVPSVAEGAREVFKQVMSGSHSRIDEAEKPFRDPIDQTMSSPATSEAVAGESFLFQIPDRLRLRHGS